MTDWKPSTSAFMAQERARLSGDGYEILTARQVPFGRFPPYLAGGPTRVALDGWRVSKRVPSTMSLPSNDAVTLHAHRAGPGGIRIPHPLDGTMYATVEAADRAAYLAGLTGFMVYDGYRETLGLPPRRPGAAGERS